MSAPTGRALIFTGGRLGDWALSEIQPGDFLVGADSGAAFLVRHGQKPHLAVGDFDSVTAEELEQIRRASDEVLTFDALDKDYTDTELAFDRALALKPREILLLGGLGTRFDHSLANVHLLRKALEAGIPGAVIDATNEIRLTDSILRVRGDRFDYVSLLPLSERVTGITLEGFQYPLHDATLTIGQSLGISNRLTAGVGIIRLASGLLLVIQSKDMPGKDEIGRANRYT